ncbi:MAG TPA: four-carbon acid sugar kinase family protein, partial [Usitatibacteraceae bacterium]|nr:four-carbon acid sugar kinase family protein [Usitatibacteraceae bacterium]
MGVLLGCIADDFTGGTDLAGMLATAGMRTVQVVGVPSSADPPDADAVVVSLKSRTCPPDEAVAASLAALAWLRAAGCRQVFFKICSTFDSTPRGNIGPVADALLEALGADIAVACPAFPANGRTVYKGHLFVGDALLSDSGMRDHPLTPMTDANLVRVLQAQTPHPVGLVDHAVVSAGADAVAARLEALRASGCRHAIADAITDADLVSLAKACAGQPLLVGGSGLAQGIPAN